MIVINALYVNLYKARKDQVKYVKRVFEIVAISVVYNFIAVIFFKTSESIAAATTIAFITWYIYSMKDFKYLKFNMNEIVYLVIIFGSFLFLSHFTGWICGGISYLIIVVTANLIFNRKEVIEIISMTLKR